MASRIKDLLDAKGLSPSAFADAVGIPRSTISHILSGRNKPSLDLIQKVLDAFPDVRTEWLVRGMGTMLSGAPDLFSQTTTDPVAAHPAPVAKPPGEKSFGDSEGNTYAPAVRSEPSPESNANGQDKVREREQRIVRIVTFYANQTFTVYSPSQDTAQ